MKIHQTKVEKEHEAKQIAQITFAEIKEKVEKYGELKVSFDRDDFEDQLSACGGWGFQDMKQEHRIVITEVVKSDYEISFFPTHDEKGFGVDVVIKKVK